MYGQDTIYTAKVNTFRAGICVISPLGAVNKLTTYNGLGSRRNTMQQKAFNLIVVISMVVIITILAGVSVPQYLAHNRRAEVVQIVELDLGGHFGLTQVDGRDGFGRDTICGCCFCWRI